MVETQIAKLIMTEPQAQLLFLSVDTQLNAIFPQ